MKIVYREDQKEIMEYRSGTMGIQAVPGAGKTFIITNLAAKLLENMVKNEEGGKILVLTYMNSAVNNFRSRIKQIVEDKNIPKSKFEVMTIHSLAMSIIKENTEIAFINEEFEIIDDYKKEILLNNAIDRYRAEMKEKRPSAKDPVMSFLDGKNIKKDTDSKWEREFRQIVSSAIKLLKYAELDSDTLEKLVEKRNEKYKIEKDIVKRQDYRGIMSVISPIYSYYQEEMRNNSYLDYDDILLMAYNILVENEDIAEAYQKKYRYVFEDECQDSNLIQGKIIELIAANKNNRKKSNKNLVRVGDVNQSITGTFAGADPQHFINFCKNADYSYKMDMASRSSKDIIDLANELVSMVNKDKRDAYYNSLEKLYIREVKKGAGYKENPNIDNYEVFYKKAYSDAENINSIVDEIKAIKKEHKEYSIGVLSFANYKIEELAETLELNNIEFDHLGSSTNERKKIINDLKAGVDFLIEPSNEENFKKFIIEAFIIRRSSQVNSTENKHEKIVKARQRLFSEEVDAFEEIEYSKIEEVDGSEIAEIENYFKNVDVEKWIYNDEYYRNFAEEPSEEDSLDAVIKKKLSKIDIIKHKFNMDKIREKLRRISMASQINPADTIKAIADEIDTSHEERMLISYILFYIENLVNF
ncbi:ATP-dependent helicase, partial [Peptostreptococcus russellii]|uniref:ATP-dependent helicase n=1 Tax=Peptostreptococcus russellii TaxID=215200 RepID=UPI002942851C